MVGLVANLGECLCLFIVAVNVLSQHFLLAGAISWISPYVLIHLIRLARRRYDMCCWLVAGFSWLEEGGYRSFLPLQEFGWESGSARNFIDHGSIHAICLPPCLLGDKQAYSLPCRMLCWGRWSWGNLYQIPLQWWRLSSFFSVRTLKTSILQC